MTAARRSSVFVLAAFGVFVGTYGCESHPPERVDGGILDAGTEDGGPGEDAGLPGFDCSVERQDCPSGESCLLVQDDAGTFGASCFGGCSITAQDCGAGLKCAYALDGGTAARACVPAGAAGEGAPCTTTTVSDTCAAGLICVPDELPDGGSPSVCMRFCNSNQDCSAPQACFVVVVPEQNPERPFICETPCDLFGHDCPPGRACYPGNVAPGCYPTGTTALGQSCTFSLECTEGAACVDGLCRQLCGVGGTPACAVGGCTPIDVAGVTGVGTCL